LIGVPPGTRISAEALGLSSEIGTLEENKIADLVVVGGSLLSTLRPLLDSVDMVYQGGKRVR